MCTTFRILNKETIEKHPSLTSNSKLFNRVMMGFHTRSLLTIWLVGAKYTLDSFLPRSPLRIWYTFSLLAARRTSNHYGKCDLRQGNNGVTTNHLPWIYLKTGVAGAYLLVRCADIVLRLEEDEGKEIWWSNYIFFSPFTPDLQRAITPRYFSVSDTIL